MNQSYRSLQPDVPQHQGPVWAVFAAARSHLATHLMAVADAAVRKAVGADHLLSRKRCFSGYICRDDELPSKIVPCV